MLRRAALGDEAGCLGAPCWPWTRSGDVMTVRVRRKVVTADRLIRQGCVRIEGELIAEIAEAAPGRSAGALDRARLRRHPHPRRRRAHLHHRRRRRGPRRPPTSTSRHGTTTLLASLVSSPFELMAGAVKAYTPLVAEGVLAGHPLRGAIPVRGPVRCAESGSSAAPSLDELTDAARRGRRCGPDGHDRPRAPGALDAIKLLVANGVVAAIGHTDASYEQTRAGDRGRRDGRHPPVQRHAPARTTASRVRCSRCSARPE